MKKNIKVIISLVLIICVLCILLSRKSSIDKRILAGEKVIDGVYSYNIDAKDNYHIIRIHNDDIYYFVDYGNEYETYKIDIDDNKKEKIGKIDLKDYYCYVENDYIICTGDNNERVYDFDLKEIYNGEFAKIIPYKDSYIKVIDNIIYFQDKEYGSIKNGSDYSIYDYDVFDSNAYLSFGNYDGENCIYNFNEKKCEEYKYDGIKKYNNGLFFYDKNKIYVTNLKNEEIIEYDNPVKEYLFTSELNNDLLYYFTNDYLRIYNLDNDKVNLFDYRLNEFIDDIVFNKNLLYLISSEKVYIVRLDEIKTSEMTLDELDALFENKLMSRIDNIKNEYNVDIKIREEANLKFDFWKQSMVGETIYDTINDSIDTIEEVFEMFGKDFFKEFIHDEYTGIRIYLVSQIKNDSFSMAGEAMRYYDTYTIITLTYDLKRTLCHELMHTLEDAVFAKRNYDMFDKWSSYNPKDFKYKINYKEYDPVYEYTIDYGKGDVYFIDNYSETNELEDRARVFENICMNTTDDIMNNQYLLKKAQYEEEEIKKYYPMLEDSVIFDSLKQQ